MCMTLSFSDPVQIISGFPIVFKNPEITAPCAGPGYAVISVGDYTLKASKE